ncbi:MAG: flagellar basal body rod protein FlgF [Novosphingobium sp.]|nr:flagellar basal body rod protein FlgF [Novosphingobium sp.]
MDRLIYTAASGLSASMARQRMIASNMANAQTIGFRAETMTATPVTLQSRSLEARALTLAEVKGVSMKEGVISQTGRDLDVACQGRTLLAVQAPDGSEAYTRRGDLSISPTGVLQNGDGLPVLGDGGPITVPTEARVTIAPDGAVMVSDASTPDQPPVEVARLKLASWEGTRIEKDLNGLFRVPDGSGGFGVLPTDENARVVPGALEQSNVDPNQVLVEMIEAQRLFEIRAKMISTVRDLDESGASLMRINT